MKERIDNYIWQLLTESLKSMFAVGNNIKRIDMRFLEDGDFVTDSITLTIERKIKCPDGQIMVLDEQKEIAHYGNRTPEEIEFATAIKSAEEYLKLLYGNYYISMNRNDERFEVKYV